MIKKTNADQCPNKSKSDLVRGFKRRSFQWGRKYLSKDDNNKQRRGSTSSANNNNVYSLTIEPKKVKEDSLSYGQTTASEKWDYFDDESVEVIRNNNNDFVRCSFGQDPFNEEGLIRPQNYPFEDKGGEQVEAVICDNNKEMMKKSSLKKKLGGFLRLPKRKSPFNSGHRDIGDDTMHAPDFDPMDPSRLNHNPLFRPEAEMREIGGEFRWFPHNEREVKTRTPTPEFNNEEDDDKEKGLTVNFDSEDDDEEILPSPDFGSLARERRLQQIRRKGSSVITRYTLDNTYLNILFKITLDLKKWSILQLSVGSTLGSQRL